MEAEKTSELAVQADDGVDITLIRWMLSLTPAARLEVLQDAINGSPQHSRTECLSLIQ